jgi:hypothetical protein
MTLSTFLKVMALGLLEYGSNTLFNVEQLFTLFNKEQHELLILNF